LYPELAVTSSRGSSIICSCLLSFKFSDFDTEKHFDTVQILGGGRTEDTAVNVATLSGTLDLVPMPLNFFSALLTLRQIKLVGLSSAILS
jgi:hypothetical protein